MSWQLCPGSHVLATTIWHPSLDMHILAAYIMCRVSMAMWVLITDSLFFKSLLISNHLLFTHLLP